MSSERRNGGPDRRKRDTRGLGRRPDGQRHGASDNRGLRRTQNAMMSEKLQSALHRLPGELPAIGPQRRAHMRGAVPIGPDAQDTQMQRGDQLWEDRLSGSRKLIS